MRLRSSLPLAVSILVVGTWAKAQQPGPEAADGPMRVVASAPTSPLAAPPTQEPDDFLRVVPKEALVVVSVGDIEGLLRDGANNAWFRLLADPRMRRLTERVAGNELDEIVGRFAQLRVLGEIQNSAAAFGLPGPRGNSFVTGVLVDPGAGEERLFAAVDLALGFLDARFPVQSELHGDTELIAFDLTGAVEGSPLEGAVDPTLVVLRRSGLTGVLAGAPAELVLEVARGVVDRHAGSSDDPGFSRDEDLLDARQSVGPEGTLELLVKSSELLALAMDRAPGQIGEEELHVISMLGLRDVRWAYGNAGVGPGEELDFEFGIHVPDGTPVARAADLLRPISPSVFEWMPPDCLSVVAVGFDVVGLKNLLLAEVKEIQGEEQVDFEQRVAAMSALLGVNLEGDLFDQLSGDFGHFMMPSTERDGPMSFGHTGLIIGLADGEVVEEAFATLLDSPMFGSFAGDVDTVTFEGREVWSVSGPLEDFAIGWAFTDSALLVSEGEASLHAMLKSTAEGERRTVLDNPTLGPWLRGAGRASVLAVTDTPATLGQALRLLRGVSVRLSRAGDDSAGPLDLLGSIGPELVDEYFSGALMQRVERGPRSLSIHVAGR